MHTCKYIFWMQNINIAWKEEKELKRLCRALLLSKLGSSSKFPRNAMHVSKEILGLGVFLPLALIAI